MNKVGYISYHNDGNKLQLDNVLNSKDKLPFAKNRYFTVSSCLVGGLNLKIDRILEIMRFL